MGIKKEGKKEELEKWQWVANEGEFKKVEP